MAESSLLFPNTARVECFLEPGGGCNRKLVKRTSDCDPPAAHANNISDEGSLEGSLDEFKLTTTELYHMNAMMCELEELEQQRRYIWMPTVSLRRGASDNNPNTCHYSDDTVPRPPATNGGEHDQADGLDPVVATDALLSTSAVTTSCVASSHVMSSSSSSSSSSSVHHRSPDTRIGCSGEVLIVHFRQGAFADTYRYLTLNVDTETDTNLLRRENIATILDSIRKEIGHIKKTAMLFVYAYGEESVSRSAAVLAARGCRHTVTPTMDSVEDFIEYLYSVLMII